MTRVFQAWSGPDDLAETRRRCTRINYYLDWFCFFMFLRQTVLASKVKNITNAYCELTRSCIAFTLFFPGLFNLYLYRSAFTRALVSSSKALDALDHLDHARRTWSLHVSIWAMKRSQPKQRRFVRVILSLDSDGRTRRKRYAERVLNDIDRIGLQRGTDIACKGLTLHNINITTYYNSLLKESSEAVFTNSQPPDLVFCKLGAGKRQVEPPGPIPGSAQRLFAWCINRYTVWWYNNIYIYIIYVYIYMYM